jgi:hypothetical protein
MNIFGLRQLVFALIIALPLGSLFGGCIAPPGQDDYKHSTGWLPGGGLEMVQPVDIAVVPLTLRSEDTGIPTTHLREQLYKGLIGRLYSPLPLTWVDGGGSSDAVLMVTMLGWDRKDLKARGAILARAEARMIQGSDVLWAVELTREVSANSFGGEAKTNVIVGEMRCAEVFAKEILELLPMRDALSAQ